MHYLAAVLLVLSIVAGLLIAYRRALAQAELDHRLYMAAHWARAVKRHPLNSCSMHTAAHTRGPE